MLRITQVAIFINVWVSISFNIVTIVSGVRVIPWFMCLGQIYWRKIMCWFKLSVLIVEFYLVVLSIARNDI